MLSKIMKIKSAIFVISIFLGLILVFSSVASAKDSAAETPKPTEASEVNIFSRFSKNSETPEPSKTPEASETPESSETPEPSETPRVKGIDRLEGLRLEFCQKHEDEVDTRLTSLGNLVANVLGKFDAIAARVEQFYTNKVIPTGRTVPNYDALLADITAKRTAVTTALSNTQNDINGFSCTAENPKGQIRLFRTDMQTVKRTLQDYRTSIKNLIVAVRSVVGETESESPKPSETPEATPTAAPSATP